MNSIFRTFTQQSTINATTTLIKRSFTYIPDTHSRYFMVKYKFVEDFSYKRVGCEKSHLEGVREHEENGSILFGGNSVINDSAFFLFNSKNERTPYDFIQQDSYYKQGLVSSFEIREIEMPKRSESKEILTAQKFN